MWKQFQKQLQQKISKLPKWVTNPFFIAISVFAVWMMFFDENNLIMQLRRYRELSTLLEQRNFYIEQIKVTDRAYSELTENPATQEKFAREHYRMKRDNEDVFVIVSEK